MNLNAGCGEDPWGEVRIDVKPGPLVTHVMNIEDLSSFPDQSFRETHCISVLEHTKAPDKALSELARVTSHKLVIEVPVNSSLAKDAFRLFLPTRKNRRLLHDLRGRMKESLWQFNPEWFTIRLRARGYVVTVQKIFRIYHDFPSRCYRITAWRLRP